MCFLFRYVATELAMDIVINVGDVKFYLHKVFSPPQAAFVTLFFLLNQSCNFEAPT